MKKIILIAALFAATVSAKAQQTITINNNTNDALEFWGEARSVSACTGLQAVSAHIPIAKLTTGVTLSITDPTWSWSITTPPMVDLQDLTIIDPVCMNGVLVGEACHGLPFTNSFSDCSHPANTINITWSYDPSNNVIIDIN